MIRRKFIKKIISVHPSLIHTRRINSQLDIDKLEKEVTTVEVVDDEAVFREQEIEKKRNKSRLRYGDRNILLGVNPYPEPKSWHHGTIKYLRKMYGRYGQASGINPSICWPLKTEIEDAVEYESVKYPDTIPKMIADAKEKRKQKEEKVRIRQEDIVKKMEKLEMWKQDLYDRMAKKESEAKAAKERKERLIEEVRRHFGYTVDPREDRFKELLEKKEKEQKKAMKEARRKAREEKMVEKILKKKDDKKIDEVDKDKEE